MTRSEATLTAQATTLDAIFNFLLVRATESMHDPDAAGRYLRLAFKAQVQCRTTLESLPALKNPQTIIAR